MTFSKTLLLTLLLPLALSLTSCLDKLGLGGAKEAAPKPPVAAPAAPSGSFAIIDLDLIAKRLGRDAQLQNALARSQAGLNQELARMRADYQRQVQVKVAQIQELGEDATDEKKAELSQMVNAANANLNRAQNTAQATLSQNQMQLIKAYRDEVRPIAVKVAQERGLSIVITMNEAVLFAYDEKYNITEEVIKRMATPMLP